METVEVQCPSCWEVFGVVAPPVDERPCTVDYDCEVCCRPMLLVFDGEGCRAVGLGG